MPYQDVYGNDDRGRDVSRSRGGAHGGHQHDLSGLPRYAGDQGYVTMGFDDIVIGYTDNHSPSYGDPHQQY